MRSTIGQLEEFKKTIIWLDVLDELEEWLEDVHKMLEDQIIEGAMLPDKILHRLGGNAEAIRRFENILDYMVTNTKAEQEDARIEREQEQLKRETENGR